MTEPTNHDLKTQPISLGAGLSIYKQPLGPGRGSPNWYARAFLAVGGRKVHIKSTGTSDQREAIKRAEAFKGDLLVHQRTGVPTASSGTADRSLRFDIVADALLDSLEKAAGADDRKLRRRKDHRKIIVAPNGLGAFFKRTDISTITSEQIRDYLAFAASGSKSTELRPSTQRNHLNTLRGVLNFAFDNQLISRIPRMPIVKMKDNPRPCFTAQEYRWLKLACRSFIRHGILADDPKAQARWEELLDYVIFMVASFLRPSEWTQLKHKHVEVVGGDNAHLRIAVTAGKTGQRIAVTMPGAVLAYRRMVARYGSDPETYLFLNSDRNRETALARMRNWFEVLLDEIGLTYDRFGRKRVLYSLRHTALTLRVLNGDNVDRLALAKNAGTSLLMLERHYCSSLDPEAKIANLQSFKRETNVR